MGVPLSLKELQIDSEYRSDSVSTVDSFYIPCLSQSITYCRAVGYFTSQSLSIAAKGLSTFIEKEGRMRLIASPLLEKDDIEAIQKGYDARDDVIERAILRQFEKEMGDYSNIVRRRLDCLAWLIAEERLDIKIACLFEGSDIIDIGIYHEKIGIFSDEDGNAVAFTGSPNETAGGLVSNFESLDVFVSWDDPHDRVNRKITNFERLWSNLTDKLIVIDFPEAAKKELLRFRSLKRPIKDPESTMGEVNIPDNSVRQAPKIGIPDNIILRDYQEEACREWISRNGRGILSMATGTGKTITALASMVQLYEEQGRLFMVVACPYKHLVNQWLEEARRFGFNPILAYESRLTWENQLNSAIIDYKAHITDNVLVITTHSTFIQETMQQLLENLKGPSLLVADEMHHLGAIQSRMKLPETFVYRMGLSATPQRWADEEGTEILEEYFGATAYEFSLDRAIKEGYLTEYYYYPVIVELTREELQEYNELTKRISQLFKQGRRYGDDQLNQLLFKRSAILNNASNKMDVLTSLVSEQNIISHTLFYCTPEQIKEVIKLLGTDFNVRISSFTEKDSTMKRIQLLEDFSGGRLQALAAIRCLDEGVDIPNTMTAYLLASSGNPREFIQRRGRILRKAPGKQYAIIYDMITLTSRNPKESLRGEDIFNTERRLIKRELLRFREFAESAKNSFKAIDTIWELANAYNLLDF